MDPPASLAAGCLGGIVSVSLRRADVAVPNVGALREQGRGRTQ
jgi:hypothetical protein